MIVIVDYGMGNLKSVYKAFRKVGIETLVTSKPSDIDNASAVVLPGVGAFKDCMKNLSDLNVLQSILKSIEKGKPYLGICLGLQILFSESMEFGSCNGLDVFKGRVVRFTGDHLKIPHMGWNTVALEKTPPLFQGIEDNSFFYFVHSYYVVPEDLSIIAGVSHYGSDFTSMVWRDNIMATQFHPEKSQHLGLDIFRNFGEFVKKN